MKDWGPQGYGKCNRKHTAALCREAENAGLTELATPAVMQGTGKPYLKQEEERKTCSTKLFHNESLEGLSDKAPR